jgi:hypothetical protein
LRRSARVSCRPFVRSQDKLPPASRFVFALKFEDCLDSGSSRNDENKS